MNALEQSVPCHDGPTPEFSAIIACYYEEKSIREFYTRLSKAMNGLNRTYEIIFVNDGSTDRTFEVLKGIYAEDAHVTAVLNLFRNSGQAAAITAGINCARGRHFIFMDSDLQLDPEELPVLVKEFDRDMDVVSGYRKHRKDPLSRVIPSKIANMIMRKVSESNFSDFGCTFKVIHGRLVRGMEFGPHKALHMPNLISRAQRCTEVPITHHPRKYGKSGWTFRKLFAYNMDNIVCLSQRPFQILGALCFVFALLFIARVVLSHVFDFSVIDEITPGLILNAVVISLMIIIAVLCVIGEFVIRNFVALQKHPLYIVRETLTRLPEGDGGSC